MKKIDLIREIYNADLAKGKLSDYKTYKEEDAFKIIGRNLLRREVSLFKFFNLDKEYIKFEKYRNLLGFIHDYEDNILLKLSKENIEIVPRTPSTPDGFNSNKYSDNIIEFKQNLINNFELQNIDSIIEDVAEAFAEFHYLFWQHLYNKLLEHSFDADNCLLHLKILQSKLKNNYTLKQYEDHYTLEELSIIKIKSLEFRGKFAEEKYIHKQLWAEYKDSFNDPLEHYQDYEYLYPINLEDITLNYFIDKCCGTSYSREDYMVKIKNFVEKGYVNSVLKIRDVYLSRVGLYTPLYVYDLVAILREFVILEENYTPLSISKSKDISTTSILRNILNEKTKSESYDYFIFLKFMRGIGREMGFTNFTILHEIEKTFNSITETLIGSYNPLSRKHYTKELINIVKSYFPNIEIPFNLLVDPIPDNDEYEKELEALLYGTSDD